MLSEVAVDRVYLACGPTDLRKSIDGLAALVRQGFDLDPFSSSLFVFCNRQRDKIKILRWDRNGFWLYYRRLERGKFQWPQRTGDATPVVVDYRQLRWLLDGLALRQPKAHPEVKARTIV
jgi:transposase